MTDAITLIRRSANGDFDAHRALVQIAVAGGRDATERGDNPYLSYYEASIFARMAAASGSLADRAQLLAVLAICSDLARLQGSIDDAEAHDAESLGIAELVADGDDKEAAEYAAQIIVNNGGTITPELVEMAKEFKQLWKAE
jgi:hypothetical protein